MLGFKVNLEIFLKKNNHFEIIWSFKLYFPPKYVKLLELRGKVFASYLLQTDTKKVWEKQIIHSFIRQGCVCFQYTRLHKTTNSFQRESGSKKKGLADSKQFLSNFFKAHLPNIKYF